MDLDVTGRDHGVLQVFAMEDKDASPAALETLVPANKADALAAGVRADCHTARMVRLASCSSKCKGHPRHFEWSVFLHVSQEVSHEVPFHPPTMYCCMARGYRCLAISEGEAAA